MKERVLILSIITAMILTSAACGKKIVHCDHCGQEVEISKNSNMDEDWIIYCAQCNEELFGDAPVLGAD